MQTNNFYGAFASAADRFRDHVAMEMLGAGDPVAVTYGELADRAARTAAWLAARGIAPGDRVAILAGNSPGWCAAYLGIMRAGAVAVPFDTNYTAAQVATLLADCGARAIFTSGDYADTTGAATAAMPAPPMVVRLDDASVDAASPETRPCPASEADPAVILYTSGTTSDPKGVVLTHGNLLAERAAAFQIVDISERDSVLSVLPLFHALAQMANLLLPFSAGARVVFLETVNTTSLTRALKERAITVFVVVPQFYYLVHRRIEEEVQALPAPMRRVVRLLASFNLSLRRTAGLNLGRVLFGRIHRSIGPALRVLVTGGARFDPEINRALHALGFTIQQAYGLTECSGAATITRAGDLHFDSVGRPMPGVEIRIAPRTADIDSDGPADGEVLIGGPIVMQGYFNRPEQNAVTLAGGWLHTGDLGYLDAEGRLRITGRSKEVIVLGNGKNIYPEEIEAHYERSPFIEELCVAGLSRPGEPAADRLHALIRPNGEALRERGIVNMREHMRFEIEGLSVTLPPHKRILGYDLTLDPLPRTTTRKLKRNAVAKLLREKQAEDAAAAARASEAPVDAAFEADPVAARVLKEMRATIRSETPLRPDAHLELDIGLDSMERVELLVHLTSTFRIEIGEDEAQTIHTVRELVDAVRGRISSLPEEGEASAPWAQLLHAPVAGNEFIAELEKPKRVLSATVYLLMKLLYGAAWLTVGLRAQGRQHVPPTGPYLICPNHQSFADVFLLAASLPYRAFSRLFFVGASEYFQTPVMRRLARALNVIPIDPDANLVNAMQLGAEGLRRGRVLVLFPEGERSIDGDVRTFRKGAAILSHHMNAPMVPVAIDGAWTIWARSQPFNWRALLPWSGTRARVRFGTPVTAGSTDYAAEASALRAVVVTMWEDVHAERAARPR